MLLNTIDLPVSISKREQIYRRRLPLAIDSSNHLCFTTISEYDDSIRICAISSIIYELRKSGRNNDIRQK